MLANRIALLKMEEKKVNFKLELTVWVLGMEEDRGNQEEGN